MAKPFVDPFPKNPTDRILDFVRLLGSRVGEDTATRTMRNICYRLNASVEELKWNYSTSDLERFTKVTGIGPKESCSIEISDVERLTGRPQLWSDNEPMVVDLAKQKAETERRLRDQKFLEGFERAVRDDLAKEMSRRTRETKAAITTGTIAPPKPPKEPEPESRFSVLDFDDEDESE